MLLFLNVGKEQLHFQAAILVLTVHLLVHLKGKANGAALRLMCIILPVTYISSNLNSSCLKLSSTILLFAKSFIK